MRGQSRGLKSGFFSSLFGGSNLDESGQVTSLKRVGGFKGFIKIYNEDDQDQFNEEKENSINNIVGLMQELHTKTYGHGLRKDPRMLETQEELHGFKRCLIDMDVFSQELFDFIMRSEDILAN